MTGLTVDFTKHYTVDVGAYVEASTDAIITNGNNERTHACIALGPSGNRQGSINCFDIDTGRVAVRRTTVNFTKHCTVDVGAYIESSTDALITNGNNDRTHACIALGTYGNRQGSINCFDLDTGRVEVRSTFKQMIWPERLLRKANMWGERGKKAVL